MSVPKIKTLHFLAITSRSQWSESSSLLELDTRSYDVQRPDLGPQIKSFQLDTGHREQGKAIACSLDMPENLYYFENMVLIIKGDDLWLPKTMAFYAEDTTGYVYPIVEYINWPERKDTTWSTDPKEGKAKIEIFPLLLDV
ncbi:MAG: hypothetical protein F6J98_08040 [Moorea sp. SIO4G2]|uniref:hypothetical protein n=1 Tax=unclassified Moorena TaxID=2683338 RepID=UPI0013CDB68A|nr:MULTISPECIES: hypothetical protein [unclassified Moorena]NEO60375.1 hypothetical protein [Moorena sp. SIO4G2]NEO17270.1 hypothetical protein [Moorena sp. SIO3E8]NEO24876.1 hypothetical protein [Moorena sp. SIO4A5]NEO76770.1 hypothetical protein [Moorena sp. SIO4G3]NEQ03824.1 hypothetical protein [Moorena sp. SIO3F7]